MYSYIAVRKSRVESDLQLTLVLAYVLFAYLKHKMWKKKTKTKTIKVQSIRNQNKTARQHTLQTFGLLMFQSDVSGLEITDRWHHRFE